MRFGEGQAGGVEVVEENISLRGVEIAQAVVVAVGQFQTGDGSLLQRCRGTDGEEIMHLARHYAAWFSLPENLTNPGSDWRTLIRPVLYIDENASLTQLLTLFLEKQEIAALVDDPRNQITGWITMDDVMNVLMGVRV